MHKDFVVVPIDKTTGSIAVSKRFASAIIEKLEVNNNPSRDTYSNINNII